MQLQSKSPGGRRLVTIKQACEHGHFAKDKAYQLIAEGKIDAYKDGHRTLIDLNSVERYHKTLPRFIGVRRKRRKK